MFKSIFQIKRKSNTQLRCMNFLLFLCRMDIYFQKFVLCQRDFYNNSQKHIIYYNTMQSLNLPKVFNGTKKLQIRIHMFIRHISIPHYLLQLYPHHIFDKNFNSCKNFWTFPPYSYTRIKWSKFHNSDEF